MLLTSKKAFTGRIMLNFSHSLLNERVFFHLRVSMVDMFTGIAGQLSHWDSNFARTCITNKHVRAILQGWALPVTCVIYILLSTMGLALSWEKRSFTDACYDFIKPSSKLPSQSNSQYMLVYNTNIFCRLCMFMSGNALSLNPALR